MTRYTYKVLPAPAKGRKAPGVKGAEARFAYGLEEAINEMAAQGWEYLRADILPSEERQGLTSTTTVYRSVLVFRREMKGLDAGDRPVPSLTARRTPVPDEAVAFTRKQPVEEVAEDAQEPHAEELPETEAEERAANDDSPVRWDEEPADAEVSESEEQQDDATETHAEDENDSPRR